ncbi:hypothetical protein OC846_003271 [Tilletia horrida]|uniref:Domain of unknown function at the cortex 1 domain-containing protein n=1 Tax=Tilletia horrida TaxID=155126 RepID=A0AAN6JY42_9BASI|nr:hypothetical protein OC845_004185 [Tilletia horrida]KAK0551493.1 hypothetical protein OC846_003271 [Tilletia horrida]KAK0566509.1 hypothetical protein OC861_003199 [Tilletia horrida]
MPPSLKVSVGPSPDALEPIDVNNDVEPYVVSTDAFHGRIAVRVKNYHGFVPGGGEPKREAKYFTGGYGKDMTWSIQVQGRFLEEGVTTDDVVFGNFFDKPLKHLLPYGTSIVLKAAPLIDPTIKFDLYADEPWAYSPLIGTMYRFNVKRLPTAPATTSSAEEDFKDTNWPVFPTPEQKEEENHYIKDDTAPLLYLPDDADKLDETIGADIGTVHNLRGVGPEANPHAEKERAKFFHTEEHRKKVKLTPRDVVTADFANGFLDFNDLSVIIP